MTRENVAIRAMLVSKELSEKLVMTGPKAMQDPRVPRVSRDPRVTWACREPGGLLGLRERKDHL